MIAAPPHIPADRDQAILLLEEIGGDIDQLTQEVRAAIRALYNLDNDRTIAEMHRDTPPYACSGAHDPMCVRQGGCEAGTQEARPGEGEGEACL
jgi:hypothetical protein